MMSFLEFNSPNGILPTPFPVKRLRQRHLPQAVRGAAAKQPPSTRPARGWNDTDTDGPERLKQQAIIPRRHDPPAGTETEPNVTKPRYPLPYQDMSRA